MASSPIIVRPFASPTEYNLHFEFGYRPVAWAMQKHSQSINGDLLAVLNVLFPSGHTWIPASDWF